MKNKLSLFFLLLFLTTFSSLGTAETFTYNPNWKVQDTYQYQTNFSFDFDPKNSTEEPTSGEFKLLLRYQVLEVTPEYIQFAIKIENIDGFVRRNGTLVTLKDSIAFLPEKEQKKYHEFTKLITSRNLMHYKIDSQGRIFEFTHLPELTDLGFDVATIFDSKAKKQKDYEQMRYLVQIFLNIGLNYNPYTDSSFSFEFGPHNTRYLLKKYPVNDTLSDSLKYTHNGVGILMPQPFSIEIPGTTSITQNDSYTILSSTHPFDKNKLLDMIQIVLDHCLMADQSRNIIDSGIKGARKNTSFEITGAIKHQMTLLENQNLASNSHVQWEFSLKAPKNFSSNLSKEADDKTLLEEYKMIIKVESTRIN